MSDNKISKLVNKRQSCVSRFVCNSMGRQSLGERTGRGRKFKLSLRDERVIKRLIMSGECESAAEIARQAENLGLPRVCENTVRNALRRQGLFARVMRKKPFLSKKHKALRLAWARKYRTWTVSDWERVIFSDETKMTVLNSSGRTWCWRGKGTNPFTDKAIKPTRKFGGGSLMAWGCMSAHGVGNMCRLMTNMNSSVYIEIIDQHLLRSTQWLLPHGRAPFVLQHDNDPKHTSKKVQEHLGQLSRSHNMTVLDWPPQSPDLNPIEHLWVLLKQRVREGPPIRSVDALWERMEPAWWSLEASYCRHLVSTMPKRVAAVIEAGGGYTKY
jgi:hypothetical protein